MVFADTSGRVLAFAGDPGKVAYMRSAAKPIQVLPVIETGAADRFGFTDRELAVMCGSHSGQDEHLQAVAAILSKVGINEGFLGCGTHQPLSRYQSEKLIRDGKPPTPLHNNCSGKHAGMLALAVHLGFPIDGYWRETHPVQQLMRRVVGEMTGRPEGDISVGIDGCGVSVFGVPLAAMAAAYARLVSPDYFAGARRGAVERVVRAMVANPVMVGGAGRFCTALISATKGRIVGKEGADGVYCLGVRGMGIGFALKIEDGNRRAIGPVVVEALKQMGLVSEEELSALREHGEPQVLNNRGEPVGYVETAFDLRKETDPGR
jgi:L-asparaginase II